MCVLSIEVPIRKKSGTLSYAPHDFIKILSSFQMSVLVSGWNRWMNLINLDVSLTTTTLSRGLIMHLNGSSSIAFHLKTHSIPKSKFWKILLENTTIITHKINKLWLQILEALHIKAKNLKSLELILKRVTMFWNAFIFFFFFNIPYLLIIFYFD